MARTCKFVPLLEPLYVKSYFFAPTFILFHSFKTSILKSLHLHELSRHFLAKIMIHLIGIVEGVEAATMNGG